MTTVSQQIFDPRIQLDEESGKKPVVWCAQSVQWAKDAVYKGQPVSRSPFFEGDPFRRKGNLVYDYSDEEIEEIVKCSTDIYYFLHKYCKIKSKDGSYQSFRLRDYQYQQIDDLLNNKYVILGWSRQSGKTVGISLYLLWRLLFFPDFGVALLANKGKTSGEVLSKIKSMYLNLPFFLQAGILGWNGGTVVFDNDSKVFCGPTTEDSINGVSVNIIYIDEMSYCFSGRNKYEKQKDFIANALPVISSIENGQCVISSTPNGKDYFYELFDGAMKGANDFKASIVKWFNIKERTQQWADEQIRIIGIDKFRIQFEMSFDTTSESLLSSRTVKRINSWKKTFRNDLYEDILSNYEQFLSFDPGIDIDFENDFILLSIDIAEGLKRDYSVIQILRLEYNGQNNEFFYRQIGLFRSNELGVEDLADVTCELFNAFNPDYTKVLCELNTYGELFFTKVQLNVEYEIPVESILKFKRNAENESKVRGLRINSSTREIAVKSFKTMMDTIKLIIRDSVTITEIENFQKNSKGKYEASIGHDDTVTPLTNFSYFIQLADSQLSNWLDDFCEVYGVVTDDQELSALAKTQALLDDELTAIPDKNIDALVKQILGI
jgi:hypothetical protein